MVKKESIMTLKQLIIKEIAGQCISDESTKFAADHVIKALKKHYTLTPKIIESPTLKKAKLEEHIDNIILFAANKRGIKDSNNDILSQFNQSSRTNLKHLIKSNGVTAAKSRAYQYILNMYPR